MTRVQRYVRTHHLLFVALTLGPVLVLFAVIRIIPLFRTLFWSLTNYATLNPVKKFIGFQNFQLLLQDQSFLSAMRNTIVITASCVIITLFLAMVLAVFLRRIERISNFYDLIYFVPVVTPWVPASVIWRWLLAPNGLLNVILTEFGLHKQAWLQTPDQVVWGIVVASIWKSVGYYLIILTVGLKNIPQMYYEASEIDGANSVQQFRRITLPLLRPMILLSVIMATINFFNTFTVAYVMSSNVQGAPSYEAKVLVWEIYRNAFLYYKQGYASSEAVVMLLFVSAVLLIQFKVLRRE